MAVDSPASYNNWWVYLRFMGSTHLNPSEKQIHNAYNVRRILKQQGYNDIAIAGVLGCWQVESGITPGALDTHLSQLPNNGEHLADLTNEVMLGYCSYANPSERGYGTGLAQWDRGVSSAAPQGNVIASYAIREGKLWYDGQLQMDRLLWEYTHDPTGGNEDPLYTFWYGINWGGLTWREYKIIDTTPERAALMFNACYERSSGAANENREDNARFWYDYFIDHPLPVPLLCTIIHKRRRETRHEFRKV